MVLGDCGGVGSREAALGVGDGDGGFFMGSISSSVGASVDDGAVCTC